jgi:Bacterial PH domain
VADRRVFRRTGTVLFSAVTALIVLALGVWFAVQAGGLRGLAVAAVTLVIVSMSVLSGIMPKVVAGPAHVEVHNMFTRTVIPYEAVREMVDGRRGVVVRTEAGRSVPVIAFLHSTTARLLNGDAAAHLAIAAVNERVAAHPHPPGGLPPVERQVSRPAAATFAVLVALAVVAVALAAGAGAASPVAG